MTERPLTELQAELSALNGQYAGRKLHHIAQNSFYKVTGFHYREATMEVEFTYQTLGSEPVAFSRPLAELTDGRYAVLK
jgi:hypothetical protein